MVTGSDVTGFCLNCYCYWDSLVSLRSFPAAQPDSTQQLVPAQENKRTQSEKRKDEEEENEQPVSDGRVFIFWDNREFIHYK